MSVESRLKAAIRDVADFPKKGIVFKDITPIMSDPELMKEVVDALAGKAEALGVDAIAGIESRGFLFGMPLALKLGVPFITIRKKGKLPYETVSMSYDLEYGSATIEMHVDEVKDGMNVLIHDDLLATGGTAKAAADLIAKQGGAVSGFSFLVELAFLEGRGLLKSDSIYSMVSY